MLATDCSFLLDINDISIAVDQIDNVSYSRIDVPLYKHTLISGNFQNGSQQK